MQLKGKGTDIEGREGELKNFAKISKNQQIYAIDKKNVHGTSITIYYTYKSPVYVGM